MLIKVMAEGESLRIEDREITLKSIRDGNSAEFAAEDGEAFIVSGTAATEVFPDVFVHAHNKGQFSTTRFRIAIDAPPRIRIGEAPG